MRITPNTDRRAKARIPLRMRCFVTASKPDSETIIAYTQDVSRSGVRFRMSSGAAERSGLELGGTASVELELPTDSADGGGRRMYGAGVVVRVENASGEDCEMAIAFRRLDFRDFVTEPETAGART